MYIVIFYINYVTRSFSATARKQQYVHTLATMQADEAARGFVAVQLADNLGQAVANTLKANVSFAMQQAGYTCVTR